MKKHAKKIIALALVLVLIISVFSVSVFSSSAALGEYTPSEGVETQRIYFAMPGVWTNDMTEAQGNACGMYWYNGSDSPDEQPAADGHGFPGYKMNQDNSIDNLMYADVPQDVFAIQFDNYIDGGLNPNSAEFKSAWQTFDEYLGAHYQGESEYFSLEFWDYIYDNYSDDFEDNPDYQIAEFGDYAQNFSYFEDDGNIGHTVDNMIYVVDTLTSPARYQVYPQSVMNMSAGSFYFYYGNGEFGMWPTKALLTSQEGVQFDDDGNLIAEDETLNEFGFVTREGTDAYTMDSQKDFVVYGKIDGGYWTNTELPEAPTIEVPTAGGSDPNKVYFKEVGLWSNFKNITLYIYEHSDDYGEVITWGSKKGYMTDEGDGLWSYDFEAKGITLDDNKQYGVIFTADWGTQTCDIIFDTSCLGDIAYCPGDKVENNVDSNRRSYTVKWLNADPAKYGPPVCITSIGNVVGSAFWEGDTPESILTAFLLSDGVDGIRNAVRFNGKTIRQTAYDTGEALGLSQKEVEDLADEIGFDLDSSGYDPYDPSYNPYEPDGNVYEAVYYILENLNNPEMIAPSALKAKFAELEVDPEEVEETMFYMCSYDDYKPASEAIHKADSDYMDVLKGDVNHDNVVDILDATWIQKFAVGKITSFDEIG